MKRSASGLGAVVGVRVGVGMGLLGWTLACGGSEPVTSPSGGTAGTAPGVISAAGGSAAGTLGGSTAHAAAGQGGMTFGSAGRTGSQPTAAGTRAPSTGGTASPAGAAAAGTTAVAGTIAVAGASAAVAGNGNGAGSGSGAAAGSGSGAATERFSFFVTSLEAMRQLSGSQDGFGGDLRYGESTGLAGADKICSEIAEQSMPGAGQKGWHAFLSAKSAGPSGGVVHARDRIGQGPWYDRTGRVVAMTLDALLTTRPGADAAIMNDLPNERGLPNRGSEDVDNHDTVTGSNAQGQYSGGETCGDWTSTQASTATTGSSSGRPGGGGGHNGPMCGHSWPAQSGQSWIAAHAAPGCAPSVSLVQTGAGSGTGIGNGGGYGGFYCFASTP